MPGPGSEPVFGGGSSGGSNNNNKNDGKTQEPVIQKLIPATLENNLSDIEDLSGVSPEEIIPTQIMMLWHK